MTDAVMPVDGASGLDGPRIDGAPGTLLSGAAGPGPSARAIAETVRTAATLPVQDGARLLVELTVAAGPWDSAAVARRQPSGEWGTWAGTGPLGQLSDPLQWELGEGPARDALTAGLVLAPDLLADRRWPAWRAEVDRLGGRAAAATRLHATRTLGSLTVYADRPVVLSLADVEQLLTMAAHVSALLEAADRVSNLEAAMRSRGTIGQAIGLLVERYGIGADQAFATLRRISQTENVKVGHLATVLLDTGALPGLHPPDGSRRLDRVDGRAHPTPNSGRLPAGVHWVPTGRPSNSPTPEPEDASDEQADGRRPDSGHTGAARGPLGLGGGR